MVEVKSVSPFVESQFPDFYHEDGPNLVAFLKAYYEWLEESGEAIDASRNIINYQDIDRTLDEYITYFRKEYMEGIPESILADKRQLGKLLREQQLRRKGSTRAFELLFRVVYDEPIEMYFPGDDILRASDGRWNIERYLQITNVVGAVALSGQQITGADSSATALVENVREVSVGGRTIIVLILSNITGTFVDEEILNSSPVSLSVSPKVVGSLSTITLTSNGSGYVVGDIVTASTLSGDYGKVKITAVVSSNGGVVFSLQSGGQGYRVGEETVTVSGGGGSGATFAIGGITNTAIVALNTDVISTLAGNSGIAISDLPFSGTSGNVDWSTSDLSANMAGANVNSVLSSAFVNSNVTVGTIDYIASQNAGTGYTSSPSIQIIDAAIRNIMIADPNRGYFGNNAIVTVSSDFANGVISALTVTEPGLGFIDGEVITLGTGTGTSPVAAFGTLLETNLAAVANNPGVWTGTYGFLSSNKFLQDSYFYQEYSYQIRTAVFFDRYKDLVKKLLHPAGTALFGRTDLKANIAITMASANNTIKTRSALTGTVDITNATFTLTGTGTLYDAELSANTEVIANSMLFKINTITSNTVANTHTMWTAGNTTGITVYKLTETTP